MQMHSKKRIDIVVEQPVLERVLRVLDERNVSGYTVIPASAGRGHEGSWNAGGLVGSAGTAVVIFCIVDAGAVDGVLTPLFELVSRQIGIVTVSDVQVIRPEHF